MHREELSAESSGASVELSVEGWAVVPFPQECAQSLDFEVLFCSAGVALAPTDRVVTTSYGGTVEYAIRLTGESAAVIDEWQERGCEVNYTSPLAGVCRRAIVGTRRPKTVVLRIEAGTCYAAYSEEKRVRYLEALPVESEEQFVNLLALLNRDYELRKARFVLLGKESAAYRKIVRRYFRRVSCEE